MKVVISKDGGKYFIYKGFKIILTCAGEYFVYDLQQSFSELKYAMIVLDEFLNNYND